MSRESHNAKERAKRIGAKMGCGSFAAPSGSEMERELMQLRAIQPGQIRSLLVKCGIIHRAAVEDPEGFDNYETWDQVNRFALDLHQTLFPNKEVSKPSKTSTPGGSLDRLVGPDHPHDGRDWDCQCARCGSTLEWEQCSECDGEGITGPGELYEQDPLWYDPDDYETCHQCGGQASYSCCISTPEWCEANPMPGREKTPRHTPEWFVVQIE